MLIKDKAFLHSIEDRGDQTIYTHKQDVSGVLQSVAEEKMFSDNGWTKERSMRLIGQIPEIDEFALRKLKPEIFQDARLLKKWLMSDEGAPWRTVTALKTGHSSQVIVK